MSRIKSTNTQPEIKLRKYLHSKGLRYRLLYPLKGKPDIVFPKQRIAIFVNGCFWHQHGCKNSTMPITNIKFWKEKLENNHKRDEKVIYEITKIGWKVITIWECNINENIDKEYKRIIIAKQ